MDIKNIVFALADAVGVSGDEFAASHIAADILCEFGKTEIDHFGNVTAKIGDWEADKPVMLLDAHIDEIGFIVTYITDDGFLKLAPCGGIDRRLLLGQEVTVFGKETIKGVVSCMPPHLEKDNKQVPKVEDIYVDTGFSGEECRKIVSLGDRVIISCFPEELQGDRITSKSLDDRSGVAVILYALDMLKGKTLPVNLAVQFTAQEETGERGAKTASYKLQPDYAIAVDVSFGLTADDSEYKCGKLGEGPMIGFAPSLDRNFYECAVETAKKNDIPYQIEVMSGETGTNADAIGVSGSGAKALTISVPLKYMHTPVEIVSLADLENAARLIAKIAESGVGYNG